MPVGTSRNFRIAWKAKVLRENSDYRSTPSQGRPVRQGIPSQNKPQAKLGKSVLANKSHLLSWRASLIGQLVKILPAVQETLVRFLGLEDPLDDGIGYTL